jgi:hypothetical protein
LTTAVSLFCGVEWARSQAGLADMSMFLTAGFAPEKTTFPVTVAASD